MECIKRALSYLGFYYYQQEQETLSFSIDEKKYHLFVNHYHKFAQVISDVKLNELRNKTKHQDNKNSNKNSKEEMDM